MADIFRQYQALYGDESGVDPGFMALAASAALHVAAVVVFLVLGSLAPSPVLPERIIPVRLWGDEFQELAAAPVQNTVSGPVAPPVASTPPEKVIPTKTAQPTVPVEDVVGLKKTAAADPARL